MILPYKQQEQDFSIIGTQAGFLKSHSYFDATLTIAGTKETLQVPVQVCTTVGELQEALAAKLGYIEPSKLRFQIKSGCSFKTLLLNDQVQHKMIVRGIDNFREALHKYEQPYGIIGAGYYGMKMAMHFENQGQRNYVVFDRYDRVGGHAWLEMANKTTRLQTEFPTYHPWYGPDFSMPGEERCGGPPVDWEIWPKADRVLEAFQICAEDYGIIPNIRFGTNVDHIEEIKPHRSEDEQKRYWTLTCTPCHYERKKQQGGGALAHQVGGVADSRDTSGTYTYQGDLAAGNHFEVNTSCVLMWPGNLCFPRPVIYPGEDEFDGLCDFAVEMRCDYSRVVGKVVTIIGHGAFTMENIRTCLEHGVKHIYVLCRKRNLTCPRIVSWFINQSDPPMAASHAINMLEIAYRHVDYNPWDMHSVHTNAQRTHCTVTQKTRFGIGDVYFLAGAYGLMDIVVGEVKRLSKHCIHLVSGRKLHSEAMLKCTGCLGDWKVDRLLKIKEMVGYWVNGDNRRTVIADPDGIWASNFAATTGGPGILGWVRTLKHFLDCPNDWKRLQDDGTQTMMPRHKPGEEGPEWPGYMITAKHATSTGILCASASPLLNEKQSKDGEYKHFIQLLCAPTERMMQEAKQDWEHYEKLFRDKGMVPVDAPYVPYLYTYETVLEQFKIHKEGTHMGDGVYKQVKAKELTSDSASALQAGIHFQSATLYIWGSDESIEMRVTAGMTIGELKRRLVEKLNNIIDYENIAFVNADEAVYKIMSSMEPVVPNIKVKGISTFAV